MKTAVIAALVLLLAVSVMVRRRTAQTGISKPHETHATQPVCEPCTSADPSAGVPLQTQQERVARGALNQSESIPDAGAFADAGSNWTHRVTEIEQIPAETLASQMEFLIEVASGDEVDAVRSEAIRRLQECPVPVEQWCLMLGTERNPSLRRDLAIAIRKVSDGTETASAAQAALEAAADREEDEELKHFFQETLAAIR